MQRHDKRTPSSALREQALRLRDEAALLEHFADDWDAAAVEPAVAGTKRKLASRRRKAPSVEEAARRRLLIRMGYE